jgi:glutathione S-transferase
MGLTLYYASGSPYAWRAQLALEHKALPYERKVLSFSAGDLRTPEFLALNPRHRVPVLVDGDFVLYESAAIAEYLDEAYPAQGHRLFPGGPRDRALVRRLIQEADHYLDAAIDPLSTQAFTVKPEQRDGKAIAEAADGLRAELELLARSMRGDYFGVELCAADYALYTLLGFARRCENRLPNFRLAAVAPAPITVWMARIEALPYFDACYPPHWKATA